MRGIQTKINKLIKGFEVKEKIIYINTRQNYSLEFSKTFTVYELEYTNPQLVSFRKNLRDEKRYLNEEIKILKKNIGFSRGEEEYKTFEKEIIKREKKVKILNSRLRECAPPRWKFFSKVDILLKLVELYRELTQ